MAAARFLDVRREGRICVLTLRREEKLNAISTAVERELLEALAGEDVRSSACLVLAGSGRAFSAGADVSEFGGRDPAAVLAYYGETGDVYERLAALPQPTVAAISGYCLGGGLELALAADLRVADEEAVFGFPEVSLGIIPSSGGTVRLVRLVGPARAKELMLVRRRFGAAEALGLGLVNEVVGRGDALPRALELGRELAELPALAVQLAKRAADVAAESSREAAVLIERLAYGLLAQTADADEAASAFAEKRSPRFRGR
jgi:enoyl-CoA hydratase/carnithine racemase